MKAPLLIHIIRVLFLVPLGFIAYLYHLAVVVGNEFKPYVVMIVTIPGAISIATLVVSFIRKQWSLWLLALFSTALPLAFWLWFDTGGVVYDDTLWGKAVDWLIVFPAQMLIPVALSYELLTQAAVRRFYCNGARNC